MENLTTSLIELFRKARIENIGIDVFSDIIWSRSHSCNSRFTHVQSYVTFCTEGISTHLSKMLLAHELAHIEIMQIPNLEIGNYFEDTLRHELYAWKKALETEDVEKNKEFFEFAQWELNRYLFASKRCLDTTSDSEALAQEMDRLNQIGEK